MKEHFLKGLLLSKFNKKNFHNAIKNCPYFIPPAGYRNSVFRYDRKKSVPIAKTTFFNPCSLKCTLLLGCIFFLAGWGRGYGQSQPHRVTGTVISASDGQPLQGATVKVKSGRAGVLTGKGGSFTLTTPINKGTLVITFVGYQTQELDFGPDNKMPITVKLAGEGNELEEVEVSTGYQQIPKERATGSFVHIDSALFNRAVSTDVISRLKGIAPSLLFDERTGGAPKLSIRGRSTIFANADPLIVVDNFPYEGDLSNLNPNDVADVSILRDAAAASIWGVRAGNGVIVITTKKGRKNQPMQVSFNSNLTIGEKPDLWYTPQISPSDLVDVQEFLYKNHYYDANLANTYSYPVISPGVEVMANPALSEGEKATQLDAYRGNDLRRDLDSYFYQPAINQQYALNIQGGSETQAYHLAAGLDRDRANTTGNTFQRVNLSASQTLNPLNALEIGNTIYYSQHNNTLNGSLSGIQNGNAYLRLADDSGIPLPVARDYRLSFTEAATEKGMYDWRYVPLDELANSDHHRYLHDLRLQNSIGYTWFKGFRTQVLYQYEKQFGNERELENMQNYFTRNLINSFSVPTVSGVTRNLPAGFYLLQGIDQLASHNGRFQVTYQLETGAHQLSMLAGAEIRQVRTTGSNQLIFGYDEATGIGAPVNQDSLYVQYPSGNRSTIPSANSVSATVDRFRSYFFNGAYTYGLRYTFSGSARIDQSNLFGVKTNQKSVPLWSAGLKWDAAKEPGYGLDWLPQLQVRATYGYNGNMDNTVTAFTTARYAVEYGTGIRFATVQTLPNKELRWEKTGQLNLGIDFGLRGQALSGSVDYYWRKGTGLIGEGPLDPTSGNKSYTGNMANISGQGWDLQFNIRPAMGGLRWEGTLFASFTTDKVTKYLVPVSNISNYFNDASLLTGSLSPTENKPLFGVYSNPWAGLDPQTGDPMGYLDGQPSSDYAVMAQARSYESLVYHGRALSSWYGSFRNGLAYGPISVSANMTFKMGYYFRRPSIRYDFLFASNKGHSDYAKRWQQRGDEQRTQVPSMVYPLVDGRDDFYSNAEVLVEKGDHIRLQDLQFNYALPRQASAKLGLRQMTVYAYANNLGLLWTANKQHIDPDYADGVLPQPLSLSLGIHASF